MRLPVSFWLNNALRSDLFWMWEIPRWIKHKKSWNEELGLNPLSANPTKWSNTLKQFVGKLPTKCLSVFDHFVKLALKGLRVKLLRMTATSVWCTIWYESIVRDSIHPGTHSEPSHWSKMELTAIAKIVKGLQKAPC